MAENKIKLVHRHTHIPLFDCHRNPFHDYQTEPLTTTISKIIRLEERSTKSSTAKIFTMEKNVEEAKDLLMNMAIEYLKFKKGPQGSHCQIITQRLCPI